MGDYTLNSVWAAGNWTIAGNYTGNATDHGLYSFKPGGNFTDVTHSTVSTTATSTSPTASFSSSDSSIHGSTSSTYSTNWGDSGNSTKTFVPSATAGQTGSWSITSGTGTATGSTTNNWSYGGTGNQTDTGNSTGNLTGGTSGNFTNSDNETGVINVNGNHTELSSYTMQSHWAAGNWTTPTGNYTGHNTDVGHYDYTPEGDFSASTTTTSPTTGNLTLSGNINGDNVGDWGDTGNSAKTLGSDGSWTLSSGDSTATGAFSTDWSNSGTGTAINPSRTYNVNVDGDNNTQNTYTLNSDWNGSAWETNYGTQDTTVENAGDFDVTGSIAWNPTVSAVAMAGSQTLVHSSDWDVTGTQAQTWDNEGNAWVTDSQHTEGTITSLNSTSSSASANTTREEAAIQGWTYDVDGTASDHQLTATSTSATFHSDLGTNGTTTYGGTGNAVASSGDHYVYSNSGSLDVGSEDDPSYSGLGTYSVSDDYSASGARDVSSTVSTDYALNAGATWIASNTNTSVTGFGNATYSNSDHYFNQSGSDPNGNSTSDFFQSETVNYHYKQNPNHAISGNGTSTISGNGTMTASATGTQSSTTTTNSVMNFTTLSDSTVTQNDVYSEGAHWSETYGTSGLSRTDPVDDGPGGNATSSTQPDPRHYTMNILTNGSPWSGDGGMDMGTTMPQPPTITPNTDAVGTMPNFADPYGLPAQVTGALATVSAPGAGSLSAGITPLSIAPPVPPAPTPPEPPAPKVPLPVVTPVGNVGWWGTVAWRGIIESGKEAGSDAAALGKGLSQLARHPITTGSALYGSAVDSTSKVIGRTLDQGGSTGEAVFNGAAHLIGAAVGTEKIAEGIVGVTNVDAKPLTALERAQSIASGSAQTAFTAASVVKSTGFGAASAVPAAPVAVPRIVSLTDQILDNAGQTLKESCFVADTDVLLGDGKTEEPIQDIRVGQRVATDAGVSNSSDGKTAAADPNSTEVDPASWRLVTVHAGDWEVQTLVPVRWISANNLSTGSSISLSTIVDLAEMGVPSDLVGTVESIAPCPTIETGDGRVVLTTVNHLNDFVFNLTLRNATGDTETVGVSGYHKIYTEDRGWVDADSLTQGELIRGDHGDLAVVSLAADLGIYRVYNMTVETDHVYYAGDLDALVHNAGCYDVGPYNDLTKAVGDGFDAHHVPQASEAERLVPGFTRPTGPSIAIPPGLHRLLPKYTGWAGTPSALVTQQIADLAARGVPKSALANLRALISGTLGI